jgi:hypothetical protein
VPSKACRSSMSFFVRPVTSIPRTDLSSRVNSRLNTWTDLVEGTMPGYSARCGLQPEQSDSEARMQSPDLYLMPSELLTYCVRHCRTSN